MKKHIIGLVIFSFIVGAVAFGYRFFYISRQLPVSVWTVKSQEENTNDTIKIKQAVYDMKTELFSFEPVAGKDEPVELHFFVKDKNDMRYVGSLFFLKTVKENGVRSCIRCLENIDSYENLYVMAESTSWNEHQNDARHSKFDINKATPVLLSYGE